MHASGTLWKINKYMFLGHTVGYCVYVVQEKYGENIEDHYGTDQVKWVNNFYENFNISIFKTYLNILFTKEKNNGKIKYW